MIDLKALRDLLKEEIGEAEARVQSAVKRSLPGATEDAITTLFVNEAEGGLEEATNRGRIAVAVRSDLERAFRDRGCSPPGRLKHLTDGLVARVRKQQPSEERRTGGDFGLLVVEPQFQLRWGEQLLLRRGGFKQGLLVQAKRRGLDGRWNQLTSTQEENLPERQAYTAVVLFEFNQSNPRDLCSFRWYPIADYLVSEVSRWLKLGEFPEAIDTVAIVDSLSRRELGTDDEEIISREICPEAGEYLVIEIDWKDGQDPKDLIFSVNRETLTRRAGASRVRMKVRA